MPDPHNPETSTPDDDEPEGRGRANLAALAFIVLLFLGALWLFSELQRHRDVENCIASGRRDCIDLNAQAPR